MGRSQWGKQSGDTHHSWEGGNTKKEEKNIINMVINALGSRPPERSVAVKR